MKIAINWFEVTLSTTELAVPAQTLATAEQGTQSSPESPRHSHRVLQRRGHTAIRLLHITNSPPSDTCLDMVRSADDPDFVKAVIEEGFAQRLVERGFTVRRKHVGRTAYLPTDESLWSDIYTFMRGLEFRGFYFMGATGLRWGIVLNYATSQRFSLSLADPTLRAMALGRRVVRMAASHEAGGTAQVRSGLLVSVEQDAAHVDFGDGESVKAPLNEWTLICRRELLQEYVHQARGQKAAAELIRRMQQASFCLTDSGRMNTSLAKSQVQAIQHLLRQHDLTTFRLPLPGDPPASLSRQPLTISECPMRFPSVRHIRRPVYVFSEDGTNTHVDKLRGLLRFAPLRTAKTPEPQYLFVFCESDRDFANQLYFTLRKGIASFPGSHQFVGLPISTERLDALRLPPDLYRMGRERELYEAIDSYLDTTARRPDFAYIIGDASWKFQRPTPYGAIKAALLHRSIPSQMVTKQLMQSESQFRYAIPNIALSALAKLGGVPWLVNRSGELPALVIGVGTTVIADWHGKTNQRLLGYAICMLSTGLFLDLDFFGAASTPDEFIPHLTSGLSSTLDRLQQNHTTISRVSLHVSHFERHDTIRAIKALLDSRKTSQPTPFEVLRLNHDSSFMVMDVADPGYVAEEGTVVQLGGRHALLVMEGRHEKAPWKGRKPVTLEVHREYASNPSIPLIDSLRDLFHLGFVNWRGFGTKTKPATLAYAKLLSDRMADITAVAPEIAESMQSNMASGTGLWFL